MRLTNPDAVIIGSGASGGIAAKVLAEGGMKVLLLERGDNHFVGLDRPQGIVTNRFVTMPCGRSRPTKWLSPLSSRRTFIPPSARTFAAMPPLAPEPMITASGLVNLILYPL